MKDGLYYVDYQRGSFQLFAGFIVVGGMVVKFAPILRAKIDYWVTLGKYIGPV